MEGEVTFGSWLRQVRKSRDLTQQQLADRINYSWDMIRKVESGARTPSRELAEALAKYFGVPEDELPGLVQFARVGHEPVEATLPFYTNGTSAHHIEHHPPNNLPAERNTFIGRETEVEQVRDLLMQADVHLLTLVGPPGIGKTRLGMRVARAVLDSFESGAFFVSLAPIADARLVPQSVAQALGVQEPGGRSVLDALKDHLTDKRMLLVLDNFEQVTAAATAVAQLLEAAPQVKVLVTSRTPLHLYGEREFAVLPLSMPGPDDKPGSDSGALMQYGAVALFVDRSKAVDPLFSFEKNAATVLDICRRVDGIPLAIELAAARSKVLAPSAMLARLSSRLKLLTTGQQDLPARHQTLRAAIAWSYDLMDETERALFRRMGIFVGGCTLEAFEAVCAVCASPSTNGHIIDAIEGVSSLMDRSLLMRVDTPDTGLRFTMLETIREYALEMLVESGEEETVRRCHADYFLGLAEYAEPELRGPHQAAWLRRLEEEHNNMRAALNWSRNLDTEAFARLAAALRRFWYMRSYLGEGMGWLDTVLIIDEELPSLLRANVRFGAGALAINLGNYKYAEKLLRESLGLYQKIDNKNGIATCLDQLGVVASYKGDHKDAKLFFDSSLALRRRLSDKGDIAISLNNLAHVVAVEGDYGRARTLLEEALCLVRDLGNLKQIAISLNNLGHVARSQGDYGSARRLYDESLTIKRELGDREGIASSLNSLGQVALYKGDYFTAGALLEESLAMFRDLGEKVGITMATNSLGHLMRSQGDYHHARTLYQKNLVMLQELGDKQGIAVCLMGLADVFYAQGQPEHAAKLLGVTDVLLEAIGASLELAAQVERDHSMATTSAILGKARFQELWAKGQAMSLEDAIKVVSRT